MFCRWNFDIWSPCEGGGVAACGALALRRYAFAVYSEEGKVTCCMVLVVVIFKQEKSSKEVFAGSEVLLNSVTLFAWMKLRLGCCVCLCNSHWPKVLFRKCVKIEIPLRQPAKKKSYILQTLMPNCFPVSIPIWEDITLSKSQELWPLPEVSNFLCLKNSKWMEMIGTIIGWRTGASCDTYSNIGFSWVFSLIHFFPTKIS